jgi:hypothetical protein
VTPATVKRNPTLGEYLSWSKICFGEQSNATKFIEAKINVSPHGADEEVLTDETQMAVMLSSIHSEEMIHEPEAAGCDGLGSLPELLPL